MNVADKRKSIRVPVDFPATFSHGEKHHTGKILNVSVDGCLLRSSDMLDDGNLVNLIFRIPSMEIHVESKIMWGRSADDVTARGFGMGMHFENTSPAQREALETFIRELLNS